MTAALLAFGVLVAVVVLGGWGWRAAGGQWAIVATPSMGRAAPVGTLIFTRPTTVAASRVGDIVSYHPRGATGVTYTHRVISKDADGTMRVRGDINGTPDPWPVHTSDLVGTVAARWWGIGWVIRGLPFLLLGGIVLIAATHHYASDRWRSALRVTGSSALVSLTALILRPFGNFDLIAVVNRRGGPRASVVSTGVLPMRIRATGHHLDLVDGQAGAVSVTAVRRGGSYLLTSTPHLNLAWLVAVVLVCAAPLLWCLLVGLSPVIEPEEATTADPAAINVGA